MVPARPPRPLRGDIYRRLVAARDAAHDRLAEAVTVEELARVAGMSPYHFLRAFRRAFGQTPHQYLVRARIDRARDLLSRTDQSVTEICLDVGFSSLGSFSARFARDVGRSPIAYQREVKRLVQVPADLPRLWIPHCFLSFFAPVPGPRSDPQFRRSAPDPAPATSSHGHQQGGIS